MIVKLRVIFGNLRFKLYCKPTSICRDGRLVPVEHRKGVGVLHRGAELHGAMPLAAGTRTNLIVWFRSSEVLSNTSQPIWRGAECC